MDFCQFYRLCLRITTDIEETLAGSLTGAGNSFAGAYIRVISAPESIEVSLTLSKFRGPIYEKRLSPALRLFKRKMSKFGASPTEAAPHIVTLPLTVRWPRGAMAKIRAMDLRVADIVEEPLPPRSVEKCLGISSRERLRWMKDGRLPACERRRSGRGQNVFSVPFYNASVVNRLCTQPDIISAWRHEDALASAV